MNIKIKRKNLFDYVVGKTNYDPIEQVIDPKKYEVFDKGVWSASHKQLIKQSNQYEEFCAAVSILRRDHGGLSFDEIERRVDELMDKAPEEIILEP